MQSEKINSYVSFMDYFEYPMVLFEKESGTVVRMNYGAQKILGTEVSKLSIVQDKARAEGDFEDQLEYENAVLWYRIILAADDRTYYVSGIINAFTEEDKEYYALLFESRGDLRRGSLTLERVINHSGYVAVYMYEDEEQEEWKVRYISQNVTQYGYTSEQFYRGIVSIRDLMSQEDFARISEEFKRKASSGEDDFSVFTYWVNETHKKHYVRVDVHMDRTQYGRVTGLGLLVHDLSREQQESEENQYLKSAIHKSKSVVMVKRYEGGRRYLKFITPNAAMLGCNIEALQRGNRLTEDYIHPDDREAVLDVVYRTIGSPETVKVYTYRMVGDDGVCRYVRNEISITHISDTEADVEFLITDITEEKEYEQELLRQQKDYEKKIDFIMKGYDSNGEDFDAKAVLRDEFMEDLIDAFVTVTGLYSVIVDLEGKFITKPVGAMDHIGEFYDMFERPFYKELYLNFNNKVLMDREPVVMEMNDGNPDSRISGAPIMMDNRHVGTWIICAYSKKERERLMEVYRAHYTLSERVSNYLYNEAVVSREIRRSRLNEYRLEHQLRRQQIITELVSDLKMDNHHSLETILDRAGTYLHVGGISFYFLDEKGEGFRLKQEWNDGKGEGADSPALTLDKYRNPELEKQLKEKDFLALNVQQCSADIRKIMLEQGVKSCLLIPAVQHGKPTGLLIFREYWSYRVWKDSEIQFARSIRDVILAMVPVKDKGKDFKAVSDSLLAAYNYCPEIIYIRDVSSGKIYYSNKAADEAFGMDLRGYDSNLIVKSLSSSYGNNPAMRKHFVYNKNMMKWESYIRQLDKIMNVEEVSIEWYDGKEAKLVILKDQIQD